MRTVWVATVVLALGALAFAGGGDGWDLDMARLASEIEIKVDQSGRHLETEYHIPVALVPPVIRAAMTAKHPGLNHVAAEKEFEAGQVFYELTVREGNAPQGLKFEVMFTPAGQIHSQENQVDVAAVPAAVQTIISTKYPTGTVTAWEVILDGTDKIVEYHVKLTEDGKKHKVIVQPNGFISGSYLEVLAELEVPAPPR